MKEIKWGAVLTMALAAGCSQGMTDSSSLGLIHEGALASQELVLGSELGAVPRLADSLNAGELATPIELEVDGELAIEWRRYDIPPEQRRESDVIALWRVVDRVATSSNDPQNTIELSADDLGIDTTAIDQEYLVVDLENRLQFEQEFDPQLWEAWLIFREAHAVCP